jgi:hypothetical protein
MKGLETAYSEDDAEYILDMIRRPNPYYTIPSEIFVFAREFPKHKSQISNLSSFWRDKSQIQISRFQAESIANFGRREFE